MLATQEYTVGIACPVHARPAAGDRLPLAGVPFEGKAGEGVGVHRSVRLRAPDG